MPVGTVQLLAGALKMLITTVMRNFDFQLFAAYPSISLGGGNIGRSSLEHSVKVTCLL
jgi:hypothetical protein